MVFRASPLTLEKGLFDRVFSRIITKKDWVELFKLPSQEIVVSVLFLVGNEESFSKDQHQLNDITWGLSQMGPRLPQVKMAFPSSYVLNNKMSLDKQYRIQNIKRCQDNIRTNWQPCLLLKYCSNSFHSSQLIHNCIIC